jgi:pimeloyl-ACP methyl ester carboxylesterase
MPMASALRGWIAAAALVVAGLVPAAAGQTIDPMIPRADYGFGSLWLCRPDLLSDACRIPLDVSVIAANGRAKAEKFKPNPAPAIDCFYVYPTVSLDPGYISDWTPDRMELDSVKIQFARFSSACRTFAPIYRQRTLTALRAASGGPAPAGNLPPGQLGGYTDVADAFAWYMANENRGRGFMLIGHSQGAGLVARLIQREIDGKPIQKQMVSAMILGSTVLTPPGADAGGTFPTIPLCRREDQTGCVITYSTFRSSNPPPEESRFARGRDGQVAACTNPANLAGGSGVSDAIFLAQGFLNGSGGTTQPAWAKPAPKLRTPFVKVPGLVSLSCRASGEFNYLEMTVNADPKDKRTDELAGEVIRATGPDLAWGLHLIDVDVAMGDLLRILGKQAAAYAAKPAG